jgi:hypothetical protein
MRSAVDVRTFSSSPFASSSLEMTSAYSFEEGGGSLVALPSSFGSRGGFGFRPKPARATTSPKP